MQDKQFWPKPHPFLSVERGLEQATVSSEVIADVKLYNLEIRLCDQNANANANRIALTLLLMILTVFPPMEKRVCSLVNICSIRNDASVSGAPVVKTITCRWQKEGAERY